MEKEFIILKLDDKQASFHEEMYLNAIEKLESEIALLEERTQEKKVELSSYRLLLQSVKRSTNGYHKGSSIVDLGKPADIDYTKFGLQESKWIAVTPTNSLWSEVSLDFKSASLSKKCEFVLDEGKILLSVRQLADRILKHESDLLIRKEITYDKFIKNISATLVQKVSKKDTFFRETSGAEYRYGLLKLKSAYGK